MFHGRCVGLTSPESAGMCLHAPTQTSEGEEFRQPSGVVRQIGFFFFSQSLKLFTFNQAVGNFNTSKDISVWYLSDRKEYNEFLYKEHIKIIFLKECYRNFSKRNISPFIICNSCIYNTQRKRRAIRKQSFQNAMISVCLKLLLKEYFCNKKSFNSAELKIPNEMNVFSRDNFVEQHC